MGYAVPNKETKPKKTFFAASLTILYKYYAFRPHYMQYIAFTVCPRSLDPFYVVSYYMKLVMTSWTNSIRIKICGRCVERIIFICIVYTVHRRWREINRQGCYLPRLLHAVVVRSSHFVGCSYSMIQFVLHSLSCSVTGVTISFILT